MDLWFLHKRASKKLYVRDHSATEKRRLEDNIKIILKELDVDQDSTSLEFKK